MSLPLEGIRVVDLSTYVAAPGAARLLSDLGADVVKIESFSGDPWRLTGMGMTKRGDQENPVFEVYNVGKRSIRLNIKEEEGRAVLHRMLESADIFLTNTRAKALDKLGLDPDTLTARYPRLIYASINGYGDQGPDANTAGFDSMAFWTRSGFLVDMAEVNSTYPVCTPTGIGDCVAGLALVAGIMTALYNRERTGKGEVVKTSLYSTAIWTMGGMIIQAQPKYGVNFPMHREWEGALSSKYKCRDGEWFMLVVLDYARDADKVYSILGITEEVKELGVVDWQTRVTYNVPLMELMQEAFLKKDLAEWCELFQAADIVSGAMPHFKDVSTDEQAWANHYLEEYPCRSGETCILPCQPIRLGSAEVSPARPAPMPGEQTDEVLRDYGYSEAEIAGMHACGAVK